MTDDERRAFANLVLLCKPCHDLVDKVHPQEYPTTRLEAWKHDRESFAGMGLAAIGGIDEATLADLLIAAVRDALGNPEVTVTEAGGLVTTTFGGVPRLLPLEPATVVPARRQSPPGSYRPARGWCPLRASGPAGSTVGPGPRR